MTFWLHPGAEQDIADALDFYTEQAGSLVAQRFLDEFERAAWLLVTHPGVGTPTTKGRRVFPCASSRTPSSTVALRMASESSSYATSTEDQATAAQGGSSAAFHGEAMIRPWVRSPCPASKPSIETSSSSAFQ